MRHRPRTRTSGLTARSVVGDDQRVFIEHRALKARIGAHVLADLLAHEAGIAVGRKSVEQHPKPFPGTQPHSAFGRLGDPQHHAQFSQQRANRGEVAYKRDASPQADGKPRQMLAAALPEFAQSPWRGIEPLPG